MASDPSDPWHCNGCHSGDFADFDHFCDVLNIPMDETPIAFAVWLGGPDGERWQGTYGRVA